MFRYVKIKNYKSLDDLYVDFTKTKTTIKKMIAIYGENGIGKSNFAEVFFTLHELLRTMSVKDAINQFLKNHDSLNLESVNTIFQKRFKDIKTIISECKTFNTSENMSLEFGFSLNNKDGCYLIIMDDNEIIYESLDYVLNKNKVNLFTISKNQKRLNENLFFSFDYKKEIDEQIDKYWGKHSFFSILNYELDDKKSSFIVNSVNNELLNILQFLNHISIRLKHGNREEFNVLGVSHRLFAQLDSGIISSSKENELLSTERLLNSFFCSLYSDIVSVHYQVNHVDDKLKYQLFVQKKIGNNFVDINFKNESTGTQNLLDLLPFIIAAIEGQVVVIDELETGIHDLLVESIIETLYNNITGQLIFTTHNTRLLESQLPKDIMYLLRYNNGKKELITFDKDERIQRNNNLRKKYFSSYCHTYSDKDLDFNKMLLFIDINKRFNLRSKKNNDSSDKKNKKH